MTRLTRLAFLVSLAVLLLPVAPAYAAGLRPPQTVSATALSYDRIEVTWSTANGTGYVVLRSTTSGGPYTPVGSTYSTRYVDTGLTGATRYYYVVASTYGGSTSRYSKEASATTQLKPPLVVNATGDADRITLGWAASPKATSYAVLRWNNGTWDVLGTTSGTSYSDTSVAARMEYLYKVRALAGSLTGDSHDVRAFTGAPTRTTLAASPAITEDGQALVLTATVQPVNPTTPYMGDVAFVVDGQVIGHVQVDPSYHIAEITLNLPPGSHVLHAHYAGNYEPSLGASSSPAIVHNVVPGYGQLAFQPYKVYGYGTDAWPVSTAVADVTGDGRADVLMTTTEYIVGPLDGYRLLLFVQRADGTLAEPQVLTTHGPPAAPMTLATGDVDGDGDTDVALTANGGVDVFLQAGGGLSAPVLIPTSWLRDLRLADVNGDRRADIVVAEQDRLTVRHSVDGRTFAEPIVVDTWLDGSLIDVGDVTGDGRLDIVQRDSANYVVQKFRVYAQDDSGGFRLRSEQAVPTSGGSSVSSLAVGDLTGDGRADLALTVGGNDPRARIVVFAQTEAGELANPVSYPVYDIPQPIVLADVNRDALLDVVTAHGGWYAVGVSLQRPDGTLGRHRLYSVPYATYPPRSLAVGDITGDGRPDLTLADYNSGLVVLQQG